MPEKKLERWLLVNYAGYPYAANSLLPDNGLATLAAVLVEAGAEVQVLDYATVSMLEQFSAPALTRRLLEAWELAFPEDDAAPGPLRKLSLVGGLQRAERRRWKLQRQAVARLSAELVRRVKADDIQALGFKLWNGDGVLGSAVIAAAVKRACPDVRIFAGGPHVDMFMEMILERFDGFDAAAFGEGEHTVRQLAETGGDPAAWPGIPNLLVRQDGRICRSREALVDDLDALPLPLYDEAVYPAMAGDEKIRIAVIDDSRGCGNNCAFCIHPVKSHHCQRTRSIERLLREVSALGERHGIHTFRFAGSCTPYSLLNAFAAAVLETGLDVAYTSFAHVRNAGEADFERMYRSGCLGLFFGVESGSQRILDRMRKGVRAADMAPALKRAAEAGIFTVCSLIYPAPGEDEASTRETRALVEEVRPGGITVQPPLVIPRTDWFEHPERYDIRFHDRNAYLDTALTWKAKMLLPTAFWNSAPVSIGGHRFKRTLGATARFAKSLAQSGLPTGISDDTVLMSRRLDRDVVSFRNETRRAFFAGDAPAIRALVSTLTQRV